MHVRSSTACVVLLATIAAFPLRAIGQTREGLRIGLTAPTPPTLGTPDMPTIRRAPRSYWLVGAIATAVPAMIAFQLVVKSDGDPFLAHLVKRVAATAIVGVVFAVPGAVIGGLFPKGEKRDSTTVH